MSRPYGDARSRLPREPYPGLRPFLDFEAALLFGRERQVREVIEHLGRTQFVAVLGGSGSGKSSLIHAGVVPELRSFGIPGAGDLWLPMTCTPGTNVSAADIATRRVSPITRLARRFGGLLKSLGSPEADAQREREIAEVFRQEAGFARLLDVYGAQLDVPPGPDPAQARVLFVLDQFEEIFHPTNQGVADAVLLVERVLDHFFHPHPRCHVVLTMRSEHLNDCASFLDLPEAINKASYLIRRLNDDELRGAITGPAQRFLRLVARSQPEGEAAKVLPTEVRFEAAVLERLLRDVKAITRDPDHLPLLQHLLARLWEAALEREEMDVPVPSWVTEIDLVRAVSGGRAPAGDEQPLDDKINTLRACVENWPETLYAWHSDTQRAQLDRLFARLAFKDPNTGMYSQQRLEVEELSQWLQPRLSVAELRALLAEGFLGSVDYLFWDDEDPARVTLKVSHESFIRGWSRFRALVDREAERFEEFVGVLRRCGAWVSARRSEDLLLESGELRLLRESGFEQRLREPGQHEAWFRFLKMHREGPRLSRLVTELDAYLRLSNQRLDDREKARVQRRNLLYLWPGLALLLLVSAFAAFVLLPVSQRTSLLLQAGTATNAVPARADYPGVGSATQALEVLMGAAAQVDEARSGRSSFRARLSQGLIDRLSWLPPVRRQGDYLAGMLGLTEPPVNHRLRQVLSAAVWEAEARPPDLPTEKPPAPARLKCLAQGIGAQGTKADSTAIEGFLLTGGATGSTAPGTTPRTLFLTWENGNYEATLHPADVDASGVCTFGGVLLSVPFYGGPNFLFDSGLRHVLFSRSDEYGGPASVSVLELDWQRLNDTPGRVVQWTKVAEVLGDTAVQELTAAAGPQRVAAIESWRAPGGRVLALGGRPWRLVSAGSQRLADPALPGQPPLAFDDDRFLALEESAPNSPCARQQAALGLPPGLRRQVLDHPTQPYCVHVTRGDPSAARSPKSMPRDRASVAVYPRPAGDAGAAAAVPVPLASIEQWGRLGPSDTRWLMGVKGPFAGWLAVRGPDWPDGSKERLQGMPWSTCALWRLGLQLRPAATMAGAAAADGVCSER